MQGACVGRMEVVWDSALFCARLKVPGGSNRSKSSWSFFKNFFKRVCDSQRMIFVLFLIFLLHMMCKVSIYHDIFNNASLLKPEQEELSFKRNVTTNFYCFS